MNILSIVNIPEKLINELKAEYPGLNIRSETSSDKYAEHLQWADIVFGNLPVGMALTAPRLKWLQIVSSGIDAYLPLTNTDVKVTSAKGVHSETIAHHVMMMILIFSRNFLNHQAEQHLNVWNRNPDAISSLKGKRLGLIGYGSIGQHLAPLARAFGMEVLAVKKNPENNAEQTDIEILGFQQLDYLLSTADHIVVCLPYTSETVGLLDFANLNKIKEGAYLHNVSRGEIIDEYALVKLLKTGQIAGAALDVFTQEPLPAKHPFWNMPNVIVTPHIAGHYKGLRESTFNLFKTNLARYLADKPMINEVVFERGY